MLLRLLSNAALAVLTLAPALATAQMPEPAPSSQYPSDHGDPSKGPLVSPAATANVTIGGQTLTISYNTPSLRGRHLGGPEIVPWNQVWRTGANPATTLITPIPLHIGRLLVPAGTYTIYTLPSPGKWMLIISTQTGQWGTEYHQDRDLGRVEMKSHTLPASQELMSISFDAIKKDSAELHIRWATTDESVTVSTP